VEGMIYGGDEPLDLDQLRAKLRTMTDRELRTFGKAATSLCSPQANFGKLPRLVFVQQLEEATAEWKRRHPSGRRHLKEP
jgi:hypothetical protein